eukprot:2412299-Alexandrium_andersonii.AAC.1
MSASLVGSEMCIRDSWRPLRNAGSGSPRSMSGVGKPTGLVPSSLQVRTCLLYTSDAADDM